MNFLLALNRLAMPMPSIVHRAAGRRRRRGGTSRRAGTGQGAAQGLGWVGWGRVPSSRGCQPAMACMQSHVSGRAFCIRQHAVLQRAMACMQSYAMGTATCFRWHATPCAIGAPSDVIRAARALVAAGLCGDASRAGQRCALVCSRPCAGNQGGGGGAMQLDTSWTAGRPSLPAWHGRAGGHSPKATLTEPCIAGPAMERAHSPRMNAAPSPAPSDLALPLRV